MLQMIYHPVFISSPFLGLSLLSLGIYLYNVDNYHIFTGYTSFHHINAASKPSEDWPFVTAYI